MTTQDDGTTNIEVVDNNVAKWLRASTPAERIQMAGALNEMGRRNLAKSVSEVHPHWSDAEIAAEVARRWLGDEDLPMLYAKDLISIEPFASAFRAACSSKD